MPDRLPPAAATVLADLLARLDRYAPGAVEGLYAVGSLALGDWHEGRSDIDVVGVTADPADEALAAALAAAHAELLEAFHAPQVDGVYVAWGDLSVPAQALTRPWTLDGEFHHDAECFELNPATWTVMATDAVAVRGPEPRWIGVHTDRDELARWCAENLRTYWAGVAARLGEAARQPREGGADPAIAEWCVLGPLRLHRSIEVGDVVSKTSAGHWGRSQFPRWEEPIDVALLARAMGPSAPPLSADDLAVMAAMVAELSDV